MVLTLPANAQPDREEYVAFRRKLWEKVLLNPKTTDKEFAKVLNELRSVGAQDSRESFVKAIAFWKEKNHGRWGACLVIMAPGLGSIVDDLDDATVADIITVAKQKLIPLGYLAVMGRRAKDALPFLREFENGDDRELALQAFAVRRAIERDLPSKREFKKEAK